MAFFVGIGGAFLLNAQNLAWRSRVLQDRNSEVPYESRYPSLIVAWPVAHIVIVAVFAYFPVVLRLLLRVSSCVTSMTLVIGLVALYLVAVIFTVSAIYD